MDKGKFLEAGMLLDSGVGPKEILLDRVQKLGLGFEQVAVEPEVVLPCLNVLGKTTEFAAFVNEVGAPDVIGSPSVCAWLKEVATFYLGGTGVVNTCEKLAAFDPRTQLEVPASVNEAVEALSLTATIAATEESHKATPFMIPFEDVTGWSEDVSTWDLPENPKTAKEDTVPGEWKVLNGGAVFLGTTPALIVVEFVPEDKLTFKGLLVTVPVEVTDNRKEGLVVSGSGVLHLDNTAAVSAKTLEQMSVSSLSLAGDGSTAGDITGLTVAGSAGGEPTVSSVALVDSATTFTCEAGGAWTPSKVEVTITVTGSFDPLTMDVEVEVAPLG